MKLTEIFSYIADTIIPLGAFLYAIFKVISPILFKSKLKRLYFLIQDWFDGIDTSNIDDLNMNLLWNKETKIGDYIKYHNLRNCKIIITDKHRQAYLRQCGLRKEFLNSKELFTKYSRLPPDGIYIDSFWTMLSASFLKLKSEYENKAKIDKYTVNFADIEMPIKFLKQYLSIKIK